MKRISVDFTWPTSLHSTFLLHPAARLLQGWSIPVSKFSSLLQCCLTPQTLNLLSFILEIAALILVLPWPHPHCLVGCKDSAPMVLFLVMFFPNHVKHSFTISHIPARSSLELGKLKGPLLFCLHRSLNQGRELVNT